MKNNLEKTIYEEKKINPVTIFEAVNDFLARIQNLDLPLSESIQRTINTIEDTNARMAQRLHADKASEIGELYITYTEALSSLIEDKTFWEAIPESIPLNEEEREIYEKTASMLSDPSHFIEPLPEKERLEKLHAYQAKLKGDPKTSIQKELRQFVEDLRKQTIDAFVASDKVN